MKTGWALSAVLLAALMPVSGTAFADCLCRANGAQFEQGELACLKLPSGSRLARCEKVLNNSSWKVLSEGCVETSGLSPATGPTASLAALASTPATPVPPALH